jgi:HEPN domain-containing protein
MSAAEPGSEQVQWAEARRWFARADEDIRAGTALLALAPPAVGTAAFQCQQAAEKILTGLLIAARQRAAKTHQLAELAAKAAQPFPSLRSDLDLLPPLTPWHVGSRYPDIDIEPGPSERDVADALRRLRSLRARVAAIDPAADRGSAEGPT